MLVLERWVTGNWGDQSWGNQSMTNFWRLRLGELLLFLLIVLMAGSATQVSAQRGPTKVGVATAERVEITDTRPVIGQLIAAVEAAVATRTAGIVSQVFFEIGDAVKKGQVLVRLDRARLELERRSLLADVAVAKAGLVVAEAELKRAEQGFARQAGLRSSGAFSRSRYEDLKQDAARAKGALSRAMAEQQRAQARLAEVDYRLRHAEIMAPFDGVVVARQAQPGAYMTIGSPVATMMDTANLEVEADVPVELINSLEPGREVTVAFDSEASGKASVRAIVPIQSVSTRTRAVRFTIDLGSLNPKLLARGMSVSLRIPASAPRKASLFQRTLWSQSGAGWIVYVIDEGKASPRTVELGQSAAERIEVKSGLSEGDVVVIRGNERLRPGQSVAPNKPRPSKNSRS